jgi:hypothetical protein
MRLIDADAVLARYYAEWEYHCFQLGQDERAWLRQCIDDAPTIEAEPVKHGRWELHADGSGTCNQCRFRQKHIWDDDDAQNYCGVCGAKMDGDVGE